MFSVAVIISAVVVCAAKPQYVETFNVAPDDVEIHDQSVRTSFSPYHETWRQYNIDYGKSYESPESEERHKAIFMQNVEWFEQHNTKFVNGETSYSVGLNQFTDMTQEELQSYHGYRNFMKSNNITRENCYNFTAVSGLELPTDVDWRTRGYVTSVKDQKSCGACWAFSAIGSLEGQYFKKTGQLVSLSEQQLIDCSGSYGNFGCAGGVPALAYQYIQDHGIEAEKEYPYLDKDAPCKYENSNVVTNVTGCKQIEEDSESDLQQAVATIGPISVGIDATLLFHGYKSGIFDDPSCTSKHIGHAVLVVGYGTWNNLDYWIVKNSWGSDWGEKGYIYMSRNKDNQCGIASLACYPLV